MDHFGDSTFTAMLRHIVRDEVKQMLCETTLGAALLGEPPAPQKRDTLPAPPPAKKRRRRAPKPVAYAAKADLEASTRTAAKELRGILLSYFTAEGAPASMSPRELCEAVGGEARDIGRHLQALAKAGDLVMTGSRRNARYSLPEKAAHANGTAP